MNKGQMEDYDVTNLKPSIYKIKPRTGTATRPDNIVFKLTKENEEFIFYGRTKNELSKLPKLERKTFNMQIKSGCEER